MLEELEHAKARGAPILAEFIGGAPLPRLASPVVPAILISPCSRCQGGWGGAPILADFIRAAPRPVDRAAARVHGGRWRRCSTRRPLATNPAGPHSDNASAGAFTCDAHHMTEPEPNGRGVIMCIERALAASGVAPEQVRPRRLRACASGPGFVAPAPAPSQPGRPAPACLPALACPSCMLSHAAPLTAAPPAAQVSYVNAHGTSTPAGDMAEYRAITTALPHKSLK